MPNRLIEGDKMLEMRLLSLYGSDPGETRCVATLHGIQAYFPCFGGKDMIFMPDLLGCCGFM